MSLPIIYHPDYVTPLPDAHRFPMPKFRLLYELLLSDRVADLQQFHAPQRPNQEAIELVHTPEFVEAYLKGNPRYQSATPHRFTLESAISKSYLHGGWWYNFSGETGIK